MILTSFRESTGVLRSTTHLLTFATSPAAAAACKSRKPPPARPAFIISEENLGEENYMSTYLKQILEAV